MFCVQEVNRALLVPLLSTTEAWNALPPTVQTFAVCSWTAGCTTVLLLPRARTLMERIGFIGGARGCPDAVSLARSGSVLLLVYALAVGVGIGVSEQFGQLGEAGS